MNLLFRFFPKSCFKELSNMIYCDGATGARGLPTLAPWSIVVHANDKKILIGYRGSRGLAPLGCLPLWGREGATIAIHQTLT